MTTEIGGIRFADEGVTIDYMRLPDDVRVKGAVFSQHTLNISSEHPNYVDEIDQIRTLVVDLVNEALEDFHDSEPVEPGDVEDDEERGMGE